MRIALIQFRSDKEIIKQEIQNFLEKINLQPNELFCFNGFNQDLNNLNLDNFDGFIFGGSSNVSFSKNENTQIMEKNTGKLIENIIDSDKLSLFICLGHQYLCLKFGNPIHFYPEVNTIKIKLTSDGLSDPLFVDIPKEFFAQTGHNDSIFSVSSNMTILANSDSPVIQSLRIKNNVYTTQFHPEQNKQDFLDRLSYYSSKYNGTNANLIESPYSNKILQNFIELCRNI